MFKHGQLKQSWAYFVPKPLLGMSCTSLLKEEDKRLLLKLLKRPLSHEQVIRMAPSFALIAAKFVDKLLNQEFSSVNGVGIELSLSPDSLKEFTLDLMNGPILKLNLWNEDEIEDSRSNTESNSSLKKDEKAASVQNNEDPPRKIFLKWIQRLQKGLLGFKFTAGGSMMQIWRLNEYGRAINARDHLLNDILLKHVSNERSEQTETKHDRGQITKEPLVTAMPLVTLACEASKCRSDDSKWGRSNSDPSISPQISLEITENKTMFFPPLHDQKFPRNRSFLVDKNRPTNDFGLPHKVLHHRSYSGPNIFYRCNDRPVTAVERISASSCSSSLLEEILKETDENGIGLKEATIAEVSMHLWSLLDASSSWTAAVLYFFQNDQDAFRTIRKELDQLFDLYGWRAIFSPTALTEMHYLDAIIYEAIRLCPQFCGGLWQSTKTVEFKKDGLQIPAGTHVLFSDASLESFNLESAWGKLPQNLGETYPNEDLHGFLPLLGLEVPLLVMQVKILLVMIVLRCDVEPKLNRGVGSSDRSQRLLAQEMQIHDTQQTNHSNCESTKGDNGTSCEESHLELESQLLDERSLLPKSLDQNSETLCQQKLNLSPDICRNWFTKMPFPQALENVSIRQRFDASND